MSADLTWRTVQDLASAAQDVAPGSSPVAEYPAARLTYGGSEPLIRVRRGSGVGSDRGSCSPTWSWVSRTPRIPPT